MKPALIIYDLDGTLVDTREDIAAAVNHMLAQLGAEPQPVSEIVRYVGRGLRQLVADCLKTSSAERIEQAIKIYRGYYAEHLLDHSRLYSGARTVLEHFKGRKQAVITNKPNPFSREILTGLQVAGYFTEIVAGDSGYPIKPDPASLVSIMQKNGVGAAETLFVGDSPIDVETGRNAGVFTVILTHGFAAESDIRSAVPDAVIGHFQELIELARQSGW